MEDKILNVVKELKDFNKVDMWNVPPLIKIKNADKLFVGVFSAYLKTVENREFKMLPEYEEIIEWLTDNQRKGLYLSGKSGVGKTITLRNVLPVVIKIATNTIVKPISAFDLIDAYKNKEKENVGILGFDYRKNKINIIDDVMNEPVYNDFGVKYEIMPVVIDNHERGAMLFIGASNSTRAEFIDRYGEPIYNRIKKICRVVDFKSKNLR